MRAVSPESIIGGGVYVCATPYDGSKIESPIRTAVRNVRLILLHIIYSPSSDAKDTQYANRGLMPHIRTIDPPPHFFSV